MIWTVQLTTSISLLNKIKDSIIRKNENATVILRRKEMRPDNCKTYDYNLTVSHKNCISETVRVKYCYGQCSTVYLPSSGKKQNPSVYCQSCKPKSYHWHSVYLKCNENSIKPIRKKTVQAIDSCECLLCRGG